MAKRPDMEAADREELAELDALAAQALTHIRQGTTDRAGDQMTVPVSAYLDADRYGRELDRIFMRLPLAVRDEDYAIVSTIQAGLASGANTEFTFGRNESGLQHYHQWVEPIMIEQEGRAAL